MDNTSEVEFFSAIAKHTCDHLSVTPKISSLDFRDTNKQLHRNIQKEEKRKLKQTPININANTEHYQTLEESILKNSGIELF